jgi:hypothetical protein
MRRALLAFPAALLLLTPAFANAADPPGRVGRLSYVDGTVSFHLADQGDWTPATVNYPVTTGESFWTDENSRAEIQVGPAELRLDQASQLDISRLDDGATDVQLDQGVLNLHLWSMPAGEIVVTTPRGRTVIQAPGSYDIDAGQPNGDQPADQTQVTVLEGAAQFQSDAGTVNIDHSEAAVVSGDPANVQVVEANYTDFDNWALARERREDVAQKPAYVPQTVTGYQDLDQSGSWSQDPQYGQVWYPSGVPADWAPYRYGHWGWVPPWGWTWIDDASWGFAPFHYGRWIDRDDRWAWVPQDIPPQPVYAPALVAFIGGDGWGVDVAAGAAVAAIGWVALAPHEEYHPDFRASETWARGANGRDWNAKSYNVTNVTVNNYYNRQAATVVPAAAFTNAAPVQKATFKVAPDQLARTRTTATLTNYHPNAFARSGRADPNAAGSQPNAEAKIATQRVAIATPPAAAAAKPPTAPGPHRVAGAAHPVKNASLPASGGTPPAPTAAPGQPAPQRAQDRAAPPPTAQGGAAPPTPSTPPATRETTREPNTPRPNSNLAPHPQPPNQATRNPQPGAQPPAPPQHQEANRPPQQPQHQPPAAPQSTARIAPQPPAAAPPPHTASVQPPRPNPAPQRAAPPPRTASVQPSRPAPAPQRPAPPPPMQVAHPQQQTHIAPTPQAWSRAPGPPPQVARAAAPPPPRPAPPPAPRPAAPAPRPAAAPAPAPHPAPPPHPAPAKAPPQAPEKKQPQ